LLSSSVVSVQLTPFTMVRTTSTTTSTLLTYQPAVTSTTVGDALPYSQFNYLSNGGFQVAFDFSRSTFTVQRFGAARQSDLKTCREIKLN
jgi:hypothetical protein